MKQADLLAPFGVAPIDQRWYRLDVDSGPRRDADTFFLKIKTSFSGNAR